MMMDRVSAFKIVVVLVRTNNLVGFQTAERLGFFYSGGNAGISGQKYIKLKDDKSAQQGSKIEFLLLSFESYISFMLCKCWHGYYIVLSLWQSHRGSLNPAERAE